MVHWSERPTSRRIYTGCLWSGGALAVVLATPAGRRAVEHALGWT